jgi:hypothetical protein
VFENLLAPVCTMTKRKFIFWYKIQFITTKLIQNL